MSIPIFYIFLKHALDLKKCKQLKLRLKHFEKIVGFDRIHGLVELTSSAEITNQKISNKIYQYLDVYQALYQHIKRFEPWTKISCSDENHQCLSCLRFNENFIDTFFSQDNYEIQLCEVQKCLIESSPYFEDSSTNAKENDQISEELVDDINNRINQAEYYGIINVCNRILKLFSIKYLESCKDFKKGERITYESLNNIEIQNTPLDPSLDFELKMEQEYKRIESIFFNITNVNINKNMTHLCKLYLDLEVLIFICQIIRFTSSYKFFKLQTLIFKKLLYVFSLNEKKGNYTLIDELCFNSRTGGLIPVKIEKILKSNKVIRKEIKQHRDFINNQELDLIHYKYTAIQNLNHFSHEMTKLLKFISREFLC